MDATCSPIADWAAGKKAEKIEIWLTRFVRSAGVILFVTSLSKIISTHGHSKILQVEDPILHMSFSHLILLAGIIELMISAICLWTKNLKIGLATITWIAAVFTVYRSSLVYIHWHKACPCLGNLTDVLHISPDVASQFMIIITGYLLGGSIIGWTLLTFKNNDTL
jgi:hypothetical protein